MKSVASVLESYLPGLDGLEFNEFIDEINKILNSEDMKRADNLVWEYEDYTIDYPDVFQEKKYFEKKQYFKKNVGLWKTRLNELLEDELQAIQEEYQFSTLETRRQTELYEPRDIDFGDDQDFDFT